MILALQFLIFFSFFRFNDEMQLLFSCYIDDTYNLR